MSITFLESFSNFPNKDVVLTERRLKGEHVLWKQEDNLISMHNLGTIIVGTDPVLSLHILAFKVFVTYPVIVASRERPFSVLQWLKTGVRNSMGKERLTGLAIMSIHRDIHMDVNDITDCFASRLQAAKNSICFLFSIKNFPHKYIFY